MSHHPGDRVFAKIKGFSNWPARINPLPPEVQIPKGKLPVFFYGTYQVSFVPVKNIVPYEKFKDKWGKPKSNPQFMTAMEEIESNPGIFMLGEDPRAESFLLQFYTFKPSSKTQSSSNKCSKEKPDKDKVSSSPDDLSSLSDTNNPPSTAVLSRRPSVRRKNVGRNPSSSANAAEPIKPVREPREHSSETSSEFSSIVSKPDSADVMDDDVVSDDDDDDDDETCTRQSHNEGASIQPSDAEDESRSASVTHSTDHITETLGVHESYSIESREARRMARKLQRKAEKKAMKKAAKREAKRLLKEQERAERHARHEAKRELKRLHRLKKQQQMLVSEYPDDELSKDSVGALVPQSPSALDWTMQAGVDQIAGGDLSPTLDACIKAELEQGNLTPLSDRPTSPLRLEDYQSAECYEDLTMVQSVQELTDSVRNSPPVSPSLTEPNLSSPDSAQSKPGRKRRMKETNPTETLIKSDESQDSHPTKRSRTDSRRAISPRTTSEMPKSDHAIRSGRAKPELPDTSPDDQPLTELSSSKSRTTNSRTKKAATSRRRLVSSSSSSDSANLDDKVAVQQSSEPTKDSSRPATPHEVTSVVAEEFSKPEEEADGNSQPQQPNSPKPSEVVPEKVDDQHGIDNKRSRNNRHSKSPKPKSQRPTARPAVNSDKSGDSEVPRDGVSRSSKKSHTPERDSRSALSGPTDVVSQLCQLCRELKASLVRGHENFALAVKYLSQLTTIPARLPQLAQAWDLMDCIKKCRRYKLSAEVREAAEKTLKCFHSIRSTATKEELAQTQTLVAAHQQRLNNSREATNRSKQPGNPSTVPPPPSVNHVDLTVPADSVSNSTNPISQKAVAPSPSPAQSASTAPPASDKVNTPTDTTTTTQLENSDDNLNADLDAKVDDVLARIRAAEQRMAAAAAAAATASQPTNRTTFGHVPDKVYGNGHMIRASAVAAAAAHIRDEEDEESVVSRVEQVAAYEAAAASKAPALSSAANVDSPPPPPPPPPPPLQMKSIAPASPLPSASSPVSVDLDLESRIERLITRPVPASDPIPPPSQRSLTDNGHATHLPPALLARRAAIANKLAAARALCATSRDTIDSSGSSTLGTHRSTSSAMDVKGDDEIYDLLGV